jgi:uncharacterized damage-inducible protein DinB
MNKQDIALLYEYNYWANARIMQAAARVNPQQFLAPTSHSFGSLRDTLVHVMDAEWSWRELLQNNAFGPELDQAAFPDFESLRTRWDENEMAMRDYLDSLGDDDLGRVVRYPVKELNLVRERVLWHCLVHVVNHGTQHRSEAAAILTGYEQSPGDIDFTIYLNDHFSLPA